MFFRKFGSWPQVGVVRESEHGDDACAHAHESATQRMGREHVGHADEHERGKKDAVAEDEEAAISALGQVLRGVEATDVDGRGKHQRHDHKRRPVSRHCPLGAEAIIVNDGVRAGDAGCEKEKRIQQKMHGDLEPVLPKDAVRVH